MGPASSTGNSGLSRYKRRRPLPALILFVVLAVGAIFVWAKVLDTANDVDAAIKCNSPGNVVASASSVPPVDPAAPPAAPVAEAPKLGSVLAHDALDRTDPAPVSDIQFRVFNASTQRNQARFVATTLTELGLKQAAEPDNDPVYPAQDMTCRGQIRFGAPGAGAARTLSLIEPCLELVRDERQDASVDIAIGKKFDEVKPNHDARKVLDQLASWAEQQPEQGGGQVAEASSPTLVASNVAAARDVHC
ncbi:envelope integrity protein Cei [Umezawaea tangerina]|uniref:LytR cell envelope-related transcriptional attenuator n=1 Tax=Umezawaea tangerina TaxID=84725 RepID=A0A2T0SAE2_9PSEU|nr:envelope integrity protein Cei [Umezawaea tangerina]PRY30283.1 LytR cell envelope-related transcriptional attenuator [Umezawaea tangerina]